MPVVLAGPTMFIPIGQGITLTQTHPTLTPLFKVGQKIASISSCQQISKAKTMESGTLDPLAFE